MMRNLVWAGALAAALGACASQPDVTPEQAARADCERRQVPAEHMTRCLEETEETIRTARELQRIRPPPANAPR